MERTPAQAGTRLMPHLSILGTRGIPAAHGGFETFAERLALWLRDQGWSVTVYCQDDTNGVWSEDDWNGIRRVHVPVKRKDEAGTIEFDMKAARDVRRRPGTVLTLGYNTGFLCAGLRLSGRTHYVNMDGIEWRRSKYNWWKRAALRLNELLAASCATGLIADHPAIANHLGRRACRKKITTITYGAEGVAAADAALLAPIGIEPGRYLTLIARTEPDNSILEIVTAFSARPRGVKLVVLGRYDRSVEYQARVLDAASSEVLFAGAVYDREAVAALRFHALGYLHGHQVGGTNPSLVEALGAGNAVIARANGYNRWVAGESALYFDDEASCDAQIERLLMDPVLRTEMQAAARRRWEAAFRWEMILPAYQALLSAERKPSRWRWWRRRDGGDQVAAEPPSLTPSSA